MYDITMVLRIMRLEFWKRFLSHFFPVKKRYGYPLQMHQQQPITGNDKHLM